MGLGTIGAEAVEAVPGLTKLLADKIPAVRDAAIESLGEIGPAAASSLPALKNLLKTAKGDLAEQLEAAIQEIEKK